MANFMRLYFSFR